MLGSCLMVSEACQYPRLVGNTEVIYLDQDQESDLILSGFVQLNDFSFRLIVKSPCLDYLIDIDPSGIIARGISNYYLLTT